MIIDSQQNIAEIDGGRWQFAFGKLLIKKGMFMTWTFKLTGDNSGQGILFETSIVLIGIMENNQISSDIKPHFIDKRYGGYAYYTHLADIKHNGWNVNKCYGEKCYPGAVVKMTFDMTQKENKHGVLSFVINNNDYGVAYDDIDIEREYCMIIQVSDTYKQFVQIIE